MGMWILSLQESYLACQELTLTVIKSLRAMTLLEKCSETSTLFRHLVWVELPVYTESSIKPSCSEESLGPDQPQGERCNTVWSPPVPSPCSMGKNKLLHPSLSLLLLLLLPTDASASGKP